MNDSNLMCVCEIFNHLFDRGQRKFILDGLHTLSHLCPRLANSLSNHNNFTDESIFGRIKYFSLPYEAVFHRLETPFYDFVKLFPVFTEDGFCFTINTLNSNDIYTDE